MQARQTRSAQASIGAETAASALLLLDTAREQCKKLPLPYSIMTLLSFPAFFRIAWKYESAAFLFFMPITIRSLLGVFNASTGFHLSSK
jgi:hypothetical protein